MSFNTIPEIIHDLQQGRMIILVDDKDRENEGDLVLATDFVTSESINFMMKEARGLICVSLTAEQIEQLDLPLMIQSENNFSPNKTAFTVSVEATEGVTTGISAPDRARTIQVVSHPKSTKKDLISPGHIFPLRAQKGGVLKRAGHTEASVDFCRLAELNPSAVICEITKPDGNMARTPDLLEFAKEHKLKIGTIEDLIQYRMVHESFVEEKVRTPFQTDLGKNWEACVFYDSVNDREHLALIKGKINVQKPVLVRVHSSCLSGDLFQDRVLPSGKSLKKSLELIEEEGSGVIVYLRMENQISKQIALHKDQEKTFKSDKRDYGIGAQILRSLGISRIRLLTNSSDTSRKIGLKGYGLKITERISLKNQKLQLLNS